MQSGPVFITLVSVSIVRSEPLEKKKKQTRKGKEWTEMKENIEKKEIILKGSTIRAGQIMSSHILHFIDIFLSFWINYIDY